MKTINVQFKILYAIGIFLIVAGHYSNGGVNLFFDWFKPYAFHVGLFVFCSGYFYREENEEHIGAYVLGRIKKLIVPLYLWNLFYGLLVMLLNAVGFDFSIDFNWYTLLVSPINDGHQFVFNLASWFIMPFFMVQVFVVVFRKCMKAAKIRNEIVVFALLMLLGMAGVWLAVKGYHTGWWLVLSRFCYFLPFYAMGNLYREVLEERVDKVSSILYFAIVFGIQTIIMMVYKGAFAYTPSSCDDFDNCVIPFVIGFLGIAFWLRCAKLLVPILGESKLVRMVADNTYSIMMHHFLGLFILKSFFAIIRYYEIACRSFELDVFRTNLLYVYIPFGIHPFAIFMVLGSMVFSVLFGKMVSMIVANAEDLLGMAE